MENICKRNCHDCNIQSQEYKGICATMMMPQITNELINEIKELRIVLTQKPKINEIKEVKTNKKEKDGNDNQ